jgi:release factor glutamine methyltransferase
MRIVGGARERLAPGGSLAVEHGYDQSDAVRALFAAAGFGGIVAVRDLAGIPRVVAGNVGA